MPVFRKQIRVPRVRTPEPPPVPRHQIRLAIPALKARPKEHITPHVMHHIVVLARLRVRTILLQQPGLEGLRILIQFLLLLFFVLLLFFLDQLHSLIDELALLTALRLEPLGIGKARLLLDTEPLLAFGLILVDLVLYHLLADPYLMLFSLFPLGVGIFVLLSLVLGLG